MLTAEAMDAHNTVERPSTVLPATLSVEAADGALRIEIPAKAIVVLALE